MAIFQYGGGGNSEAGVATPAVPIVTDAGTISGERGDTLTITGTAATASGSPTPSLAYQWQALDDDVWGDLVGETGANLVETALTAPLPIRRRATATNTFGSDAGFSNVLQAGLNFSKLVYPSTRYWPDTAVTGDTLATLEDFQTGAGYVVTMVAQGADIQPPSNAVTFDGGVLKAGAGWAATNTGVYTLKIVNTLTGKLSETYCIKISNRTADYTATSASQLSEHLTTIAGIINADPAAFTGAVIDLEPGVDFGHFNITQLSNNAAQVKPVVLRSASTDRMGSSRPKFKSLHWNGLCRLQVQNIEVLPDANVSAQRSYLQGGNVKSDFVQVWGMVGDGGAPLFEEDGTLVNDPNGVYDIATPWDPMFTTFHGERSGGVFTRIDLQPGHLRTPQAGGAAVGVGGAWTEATVPAYIGRNLTGGDSATVRQQLSATSGAGAGSGFVAEYEWQNLTSATTPPKPGPVDGFEAPNGRYIVRWRLVSGGSGYSGTGVSRGTVLWSGQIGAGAGFPSFASLGVNNRTENFVLADFDVVGLGGGISVSFTSVTDSKWFFGGKMDKITRDQLVLVPAPGASGTFRWDRENATKVHWVNFGRTNVDPNHFNNPHADGMQGFDSTNASLGGGDEQPLFELVGNTMWHFGGWGGYQGAFFSDLSGPQTGYRVVSSGNFYGGGYANGFIMWHTLAEWSAYDHTVTNHGTVRDQTELAASTLLIPSVSRDKVIAGSTFDRIPVGIPSAQVYLDGLQADTDSTTAFTDPLLTWTGDVAEIRRRMTPKAGGPAVGYGPFADPEQIIDHVNRVYDPNARKFRLLLPTKLQVPVSSTVTSIARQLENRGSAIQVAAISNGSFCIANTRALAEGGTFTTTVPATIEPGQWIALRQTASATPDTLATATSITIDGVTETWTSRTVADGPFPAGQDHANVTRTAYTTGTANITPWQPLTDVAVPAGTMAVFISGFPTSLPALDTDISTAGWYLGASAQNGASNANVTAYCFWNGTGSSVNVTLRFSTIRNRTGRGLLLLVPRTAAGGTLVTAGGGAAGANNSSPNAASLNAGASRRHLWITMAAQVAAGDPTATVPSGYDSTSFESLSAPVVASTSAALFVAQKFAEAQTEDAPAFTSSAGGNWSAATLAIWEVPA